ncbi:single-stranded DNA-binding protein [Ruminiclostridium sufflavum DSM 19573]|uniref:Single-stranded DNA-binding protein n=1 Tax=Ruminiclostridium sufflavum DSM 19573 TaxID=1121337 RepID=A0A318XJJ9_9FIRM|nr:single-stranded DNA-binding protein [Ruminiclostridium sufflavum]PYG84332.1 single-stranded DNA-binding protein [Ruminiclostridium sufflavum DSM 19573]
MIIISGRLARDCEVKEGVSPKGRPYAVLHNCVFVNNKEYEKNVPMNITAWGENARFLQENFKKGDSIQLVAQEAPHERKIGNISLTECAFTVRKILDWNMYINMVRFLGSTLSRIENSFTEYTQQAEQPGEQQQGLTENREKNAGEEKPASDTDASDFIRYQEAEEFERQLEEQEEPGEPEI